MMIPPGPLAMDDPFLTDNEVRAERLRRQRTLRVLMMFVMMLLLMDGEPPRHSDPRHQLRSSSRGDKKKEKLDKGVWELRRREDELIEGLVSGHEREVDLKEKQVAALKEKDGSTAVGMGDVGNDGKTYVSTKVESNGAVSTTPAETESVVLHYPRNASGFYRGTWSRKEEVSLQEQQPLADDSLQDDLRRDQLLRTFRQKGRHVGVYLLPPGLFLKTNNQNFTSAQLYKESQATSKPSPSLSLPSESGKTALQIYQKTIPAMQQLSLVDGFIKLYDGNTNAIANRKDLLLRCKGVMLHGIGTLSLIANADLARTVMLIHPNHSDEQLKSDSIETQNDDADYDHSSNADLDEEQEEGDDEKQQEENDDDEEEEEEEEEEEKERERRRNLMQEYLQQIDHSTSQQQRLESLSQLRDEALSSFSWRNDPATLEQHGWTKAFQSPDYHRHLSSTTSSSSSLLISYPYFPDDKLNSEKSALAQPRHVSLREQALQANTAGCEFEITLHVSPTQSKPTEITRLQSQRDKFLLYSKPDSAEDPKSLDLKEPLVMDLTGDIHSPNCQIHLNITATALRIDWETTTAKAINYSFYMMLTCLTQIVVLLRQLLHTQAQSAATRVSLLCIGWQTVLDAILCIGHILLCLLMQPLFTAFASVAFFKLLIFCVIEMKYMAIILQARNSSQNTTANTAERLRQQVTLLHIRFYGALFLSLMLFWYLGRTYLSFFVILLYSFWIPQICWNIVTEAKRPLHTHYIYGMTFTRLVAPIYMFGLMGNFLREAQPEFPRDVVMCEVLVVWVLFQAGVLILQGKYGARFMIPARFLPPKFDYSRPIPPSLLPPNTPSPTTTPPPNLEHPTTPTTASSTTRNRINGTTLTRPTPSTVEEPTTPLPGTILTLDCVICYSPINIHNRRGYMLAPCDHIFHRECLEQWMDVKMECPICRTDLPPI